MKEWGEEPVASERRGDSHATTGERGGEQMSMEWSMFSPLMPGETSNSPGDSSGERPSAPRAWGEPRTPSVLEATSCGARTCKG